MTIAIFAGGQSLRMGTDKALLCIDGISLLERTARIAFSVSQNVFIVGRAAPEKWPLAEVEFLLDEIPGLGPLGGLQTVLRREAAVLALACDLPKITSDGLRWLLAQSTGECGVVTKNNDQLEPLFSVYTAACLPIIEANIAFGRRSLHALIQSGDFNFATAPPEVTEQLFNANTPEEWARHGVGA